MYSGTCITINQLVFFFVFTNLKVYKIRKKGNSKCFFMFRILIKLVVKNFNSHNTYW